MTQQSDGDAGARELPLRAAADRMAPYLKGYLEEIVHLLEYGGTEEELLQACPFCGAPVEYEERALPKEFAWLLEKFTGEERRVLLTRVKPTCGCLERLRGVLQRRNALEFLTVVRERHPEVIQTLEAQLGIRVRGPVTTMTTTGGGGGEGAKAGQDGGEDEDWDIPF